MRDQNGPDRSPERHRLQLKLFLTTASVSKMSSISHPDFLGILKILIDLLFHLPMSPRCLGPPPFSSSNAENPSTRTFSGEFNFYDTLRSIQFSIRRLFSQNLNGLGNKKSLCGHHSITHSTTVRGLKIQNLTYLRQF